MKISVLVLIAMMGSAWGQEMTTGLETPKMLAQPIPMKCGKYQHVDHNCSSGPGACIDITGHCVDDIHFVTEKEWQEMLARLKRLESHPWPPVEVRK